MDHKQRSDDLWGDAALFCVFVLALCLSLFKAYNRDLFWHLKTGQWILDNLQVPRSDFFSFSRAGMEWIDSQWLFQVILYKAYSWFGDSGFTFLQVFLTVGITALVVFSASRGLPRSVRALAGVLFLLAVNLRIDCRPELLSCFYMAAMFFVLERARHKSKKILLAIPLIQLFFVNSEGIWPIGIAITGAYLGDAVWDVITKRELSRWRSALAPWAVLFMATALIGLAQPYGVSGYLFPLTLLLEVFHESTVHKNVISEFKPIFSSSGLLRICLPFLFFTAVSLGCAVFSGKRIRPCLFMLGIIFTGLALGAMRNISVASVVLMQVLMTHLTIVNDARPSWLQSERFTRTSGIAALLVALFFSVFTLALPVRLWDDSKKRPGFGVNWSAYPVESARFLKSINYQGPIINSENLGGYLIWEGWPEWKVFADSRMEVGGQGAILLYFEVYNDLDKLASLSDSAGARAAVFTFRHPYTDLFQKMVEDERWALVHLDWNNGVFLRRGGDWEGVINRNEIKDPLSYEISRPD